MKKMIFLVTGFAVLLAGAYGSTFLFAQGTPAGGGGQPTAQPGTKIAVVNIGLIFHQYKRAQAMKLELEKTLEQPKAKAKKLMDEIVAWEKEVRDKPLMDAPTKQNYIANITKHKRELEDMDTQIRGLLGKKQEDNLVTLWNEVNMGIEAVSKAYGFQIVLGYGDPTEAKLLNQFPNVNRKMQAMDLGSTVPLYVHGSVDLSQAIADTLNRWLEQNQKKSGTVQPTSGQK